MWSKSWIVISGTGITTDNFNKSGTMEQILKTGEYRVIATATDEYGLQGADEVEVVVK